MLDIPIFRLSLYLDINVIRILVNIDQWRKVNLSFIHFINRTFRKPLIEKPTTSKRTPTISRTQSKRDPPDEVPVNYRYRSRCIYCIQYLFQFLVTLNFAVYLWARFGNNETQPEIDEGHRKIQLTKILYRFRVDFK